MLKLLRADNFKSLINMVFEPVGLNLLLGSNNAGKTNLCQALRFLSLSSRMPLDDAAAECTAEPWNLLNVYVSKRTLDFVTTCELKLGDEVLSFTYELTLASENVIKTQARGRPFVVSREVLRLSGGKFSDKVLLENDRGSVRLLHERRFLRGLSSGVEPEYVDTEAPTDATMLFRLYDLETNQRSNLFKRFLGSWGYYNFEPARLRSKQGRPSDQLLEASGGNLSSVLYTLHNEKPRAEKKLIEALKVLEPRLDLLSFQAPDPEHVYMFLEDKHGNRFGVDNVSDGTLRYLAMCYLIIATRDQPGENGAPPVLIIEEPENGIFVGFLRDLFDRIEPSGHEGQYIFTSHSPYFIDLFDASIDGLFLLKSGETHSSLVRPDPAKLQAQLGIFSLGEMHFKRLFE